MTCEEMLAALNDYVDGERLTAVCEKFAEHLAGCNPCQVVVDNIRKTISLYQDGEPYPVPAEFQQQLKECLRQRWETKFGQQREHQRRRQNRNQKQIVHHGSFRVD